LSARLAALQRAHARSLLLSGMNRVMTELGLASDALAAMRLLIEWQVQWRLGHAF
jgi:hypothetical protein